MNNRLGVLAFTLMILPVLFSCNSNKTSKNNSNDLSNDGQIVKIKWLAQWHGEGKKEAIIHDIARDFSFLNQNIDIDLTFPYQMANIDSLTESFMYMVDSIAKWARTDTWPYDLMLCDGYQYVYVATALKDPNWGEKHLVNFENDAWFIEAHKPYVLQSEEYTDNYGGIAPGAFIEGAWNLIYVSSMIENKLGIKVKDFDMTIDDLIEYAKAVHNYNQSHDEKITFYSKNFFDGVPNLMTQLVLSEMGGQKQEVDPFPILLKVYNKLETLSQYKPIEQYHNFSSDRELLHDKVLFHYHATWVSMLWQQSNPEGEAQMRPCELPSMPGKIADSYPGTYNAVFVIPKNAKNKDAAVKLMQFICSSEIAEKWEVYTKCPTGLQNRISLNEFGTDAFSNLSKHMTQKYNSKLQEGNLSNILFKQNNINFHAEEVLRGQMSAVQAINSVRNQRR